MKVRLALAFGMVLVAATHAFAGTMSEDFVGSAYKTAESFEAAVSAGMTVPVWVIIFYILYLGLIWSCNIAMYLAEGRLPDGHVAYAKNLTRANVFLATGDTAMFIAFLIAYLFPDQFTDPAGAQRLMQLLLLGVFSTSLTMSVYYLYIGNYYRMKFENGSWSIFFVIIFVFFVIRLLLHYNPANVWFSMMLPEGQPNYSAWLRNIPLFIYGLLAIALVLLASGRTMGTSRSSYTDRCMTVAMFALVVSFILYALDVFYSHKIPREWIYYIYALKTIAYIVAFIFMWLGEFRYAQRRELAKPGRLNSA